MPTAFRLAWDRVCCGKILKYDEDPECESCADPIPDGKQYGCEQCGSDICEDCMSSDAGGGFDHPGYRGEIDSGHPIENHPAFTGGAYCAECASDMVSDGSLDDDYGEEDDEEDDEEMPVPPNQEVAVPESPFANMTDEELSQRIMEMHGSGDPFMAELVEEAGKRTMRGDPNQRANMTAQMEGRMNERLRSEGRPAIVPKPPAGDKLDYGFHEGFSDKFASADAFTSVWDVMKRDRL